MALTLAAIDVASFKAIARVSLGEAQPGISATSSPVGSRLAVVVRRCTTAPQELVVVDVPDRRVTRPVREATGPTADISEIAQSPDGSRMVFVETSPVLHRRNGKVQPTLQSDLLDVDVEHGVLDLFGDFTPSTLGQGMGVRPGVFTSDGQKVDPIGERGLLGATQVKSLSLTRGLGRVSGGGLKAQQILLGDPCTNAEGCFCRTDTDCDDGNPCNLLHLCEEERRCLNVPSPCITGIECLAGNERVVSCLTAAQRRRSVRVQRAPEGSRRGRSRRRWRSCPRHPR